MNPLHAALLGSLQGLTEVLPISSSAHLILVPWLLGWPESGLTFDVALHLGTLIALCCYFWRDIVELVSPAPELHDRPLYHAQQIPGAQHAAPPEQLDQPVVPEPFACRTHRVRQAVRV